KKETDAASRERLDRLERELADLRERSDEMKSHWRQEKEHIDRIRALKSDMEAARGEAERAERDGDLERAAELRYGRIVEFQKQLDAENDALAELQRDRKMLKEEVDEEDVAEFLFDDERAMIRIDMSEYQERHTVSRLIGAPPGYVGYEEGGQLTEAVRRRPYSVVLLDEIEKAHQDAFNVLLQLLDDGRLTD